MEYFLLIGFGILIGLGMRYTREDAFLRAELEDYRAMVKRLEADAIAKLDETAAPQSVAEMERQLAESEG